MKTVFTINKMHSEHIEFFGEHCHEELIVMPCKKMM